ncbi:DnaJ C-terminal domain-containing protein [Pseudomarimonas salicorniae]|uniref:DnaJ domain-containing protein n=1 Tax=Pseudomarimonas salicorniae TaxID=2933270 RepID=A0ABT0GEH8_9GAMM|nr:DnaJ C-terminal domain-containing protein [Lysobacter sp. CAU 1642]MCK7592946.1 DnaJ domain-containing protein [Lysobacter sp. CAU 1642]
MQFKDYYETLGVKPDATEAEIKSAYRRLARRYHPDVSKEAGAEDKFKAVNEAYEALRDKGKRATYDQLRSRGFRAGEEFRPPPDFGQGFGFDFGDGGPGGPRGGFSDFFESLFGRGRREDPFTSAGPGPGAGPGPRPGNETARIEVDLETIYSGGKQRISVHGRVLEVRIPKGILPGQQIRLAGQASGGGDLLLEVVYRPHYQFQTEGREVRVTVPLKPWEAALGAEISVPTLGGPVQLKVPAGSDAGKRLRLRGRGLPSTLPGDPAGDQIVVIEVRAPAPESEAQKQAYEKLRQAFN